MSHGDRARRETWWASFWCDWRRLNTYMMIVAVVALSFEVHKIYVLHEPDPWLLRPTHFARWLPRPRPFLPARPAPYISRPGPRNGYTA
jgi:hypothetical protein